MTLDDYFHKLQKKENESMTIDLFGEDEEPLTKIYFSIATPRVGHFPEHCQTTDVSWHDGASWMEVLWEVMKTMEASYNYDIKSKVMFQVADMMVIEAYEETDPDMAKQMFVKGVS